MEGLLLVRCAIILDEDTKECETKMATSGSSYSAFWRHRLICRWNVNRQDIANNRTIVTGILELQSMDAYGAINAWSANEASVTLNGQKQAEQQTAAIGGNQTKLLLAKDYTVPHDNNGTKTFGIQGQFTMNVTFAGQPISTAYVGIYYGTLNTIPRHSTLNAVPNSTLPAAPTFSINRKNSGFTHDVSLWAEKRRSPTIGDDTHWTYINILNNVGTSGNFQLSNGQVSTIINSAFPNNKTDGSLGKMKLWTRQVSSTVVSQQRTFNWYLPSRAKSTGGSFELKVGAVMAGSLQNFRASPFSYQLVWQFGSFSKTIATSHTSQTWRYALTQADVDAMTKLLANTTNGWGQIRVWSKYNGTVFGENGVQGDKMTGWIVQADAKPTLVGTPTTVDSVAASVAITGNNQSALQGISKMQIKTPANFASAKQSATIKTISVTHGGVTTSANYVAGGQTLTLNPPTSTSASTLTITVTDSRGYTASWSKNVPIYPYAAPKVGYTASRKNNFETETNLVLSSEWSPVTIAGVNKNTLKSVTVRVKKVTDAAYGAPVVVPHQLSSNKIISVPFKLTLDNEAKWDVEVAITDSLRTSYLKTTVLAGAPIMFLDAEGKSAMFGGLPEKRSPLGAVEIKGDLYHTGPKTGIQMNNSDISGVNGIWFSTDTMDNNGEGIHYLRSAGGANSTDPTKFDYTFMRDKNFYVNSATNPIFTVDDGGHMYFPVRMLWSGAAFMHSGQTVTPTKSMVQCRHGWALMWSKYQNNTQTWADISITYISRDLITTTTGGCRLIMGGYGGVVSHKYLTFTNTTIKGSDENSGTTQNNNRVVLVRVHEF